MARFFITGSADGLGSLTARALIQKGHRVVLHARNDQRAKDALAACPQAETVLTADISSISEMKKLAEQVNELGAFDCIIHNAALYRGPFRKTDDGLPASFAVNTLAPYILTCLVNPPKRLIYISSEMHTSGSADLDDLTWSRRGEGRWNDIQGYCDTKLQTVILSFAIARKWPSVSSSVLDPGWVPTKMGGAGAPDDINKAISTYIMLATGDDMDGSRFSGKYFRQSKERRCRREAKDERIQDQLLMALEEITGIKFPALAP